MLFVTGNNNGPTLSSHPSLHRFISQTQWHRCVTRMRVWFKQTEITCFVIVSFTPPHHFSLSMIVRRVTSGGWPRRCLSEIHYLLHNKIRVQRHRVVNYLNVACNRRFCRHRTRWPWFFIFIYLYFITRGTTIRQKNGRAKGEGVPIRVSSGVNRDRRGFARTGWDSGVAEKG